MADIFNMADTWNAGGTTFTSIKMNVTDTASAAASLLMDLQVGGASLMSVSKAGLGIFLGGVGVSANQNEGIALAAANILGFRANNGVRAGVSSAGFVARSSNAYVWSSGDNVTAAFDLALYRGGAGILEQRNAANAQSLRWYHTYTDALNYQRGALKTAAGYVEVAAETAGSGADDLDVLLTPAGTGRVRFGTHSALGGESVTGFITIKDAGGTERKVAVVS